MLSKNFMVSALPNFLKGLLFLSVLNLTGCRSQEILLEKIEVKVSREEPKSDCRLIGHVEGRANGVNGTSEEALADLKTDAARKGANYVQYAQASALGTALRGTAYFCP